MANIYHIILYYFILLYYTILYILCYYWNEMCLITNFNDIFSKNGKLTYA